MSVIDLTNKSKYVLSLIQYIQDTKPYHSKLTEALEEYNFSDLAAVEFEEKLSIRTKISPAWTYNYFSSGNNNFRVTPIHRVVNPVYQRHAYTAGTDELTDLAGVDYVYSKRRFDGLGINDGGTIRAATAAFEPMTEGLDFFQSHGSFQFQVKQTADSTGNHVPLWSETRDDGVMSAATEVTRTNALDLTNPNSSLSRLRVLMDEFLTLTEGGGSADLKSAMADVFAIAGVTDPVGATSELLILIATATADRLTAGLLIPYLPQTYEALINNMVSLQLVEPNPFLTAAQNLVTAQNLEAIEEAQAYFKAAFEELTPGLFFGTAGDANLRLSGALAYSAVAVPSTTTFYLKVNSIVPVIDVTNYEEWRLEMIDTEEQKFQVIGSVSGVIGTVLAGEEFISSKISFNTSIDPAAEPFTEGVVGVYTPAALGDTVVLTPKNRITVHPSAALETWNLINVNPIAYTRPVFRSTRIGGIMDLNGTYGSVSIVSSAAAGNISVTRRADGYFELKNLDNPLHYGTMAVDELYNDGLVAFTIQGGEYDYQTGDAFFIKIVNAAPQVQDLDLGFGYDLDSYDMPDLLYERPYTTIRRINFSYDARITDYDLGALNLQISADAVNNRSWRIRAIPDDSAPISTVKRKADDTFDAPYLNPPVGYPAAVDLSEGRDTGEVVNSGPVYRTLPDGDPDEMPPELQLFIANKFALEYSDDDFNTITLVNGNISVGDTVVYEEHGISFVLAAASKPFIGAKSLDEGVVRSDLGGDVFSFRVINPDPYLEDTPIGLVSAFVPRLRMHGDGFFKTAAADWTILFSSPTDYTVTSQLGTWIGSLNLQGLTASEGYSFRNDYVHFTFVPGAPFIAGDYFTFSTFSEKPTYLVHGSVSGWTGTATVGEYFWNGAIGFKAVLPNVITYAEVSGQVQPVEGYISFDYLRADVVDCIYSFEEVPTGYVVSRSDAGIIGHVAADGTFVDKLATFTLLSPTGDFRVELLNPTPLPLWNCQDAVIFNPVNLARLPETGDQAYVEKTENGDFSINLTASSVDLSPLKPIAIDQRFIDTNTNSAISLDSTSPDAVIYTGWIPTYTQKFDSSTSIAEFSDPATRCEIYAAGNGRKLGTIQPSSTNLNTPIIFTWDSAFFDDYLPQDAESNIVIRSPGMDDKVRAHISESLKLLIGSGPLLEDYEFNDEISISLVEDHSMAIGLSYANDIDLDIADGPFTGFASGYDTQQYEWEARTSGTTPSESDITGGLYDAGTPVDIVSVLSKLNLTDAERQGLLDKWNFYLEDPDTLPTTDEQWEHLFSMLAADPAPGTSGGSFGIPLRGVGLDVSQSSSSTAATAIEEAITMFSASTTDPDDVTAYLYTRDLSGTLVPVDATYETLETPFVVSQPVSAVEILFSGTTPALEAMGTPTFYTWRPADPAAVETPATQVGLGRFKIELGSPTEVKIVAQ